MTVEQGAAPATISTSAAAVEEAYHDRLRAEAELAEAKARAREQFQALNAEQPKRKPKFKNRAASGIGGMAI
jgi:hypothetical protein